MKRVGFVGYRGMVGSVLINRMQEENNFDLFYSIFLSTSQKGQYAPKISNNQEKFLCDAWNIELLNSLDIIVTCQGSIYTKNVYLKLKKTGWKGFWIDSASFLRMYKDAVIILDPVNRFLIEKSINNGIKTFVGGNCTVSLMLMALGGLFSEGLVDWLSISTYQAASGCGAGALRELLMQVGQIYENIKEDLNDTSMNILKIVDKITKFSNSNQDFLINFFKTSLAVNLIPWIGDLLSNGQTQEEWKSQAETNKILNTTKVIPIDSLCVRIDSLRCHSQMFTIKLKKDISLREIITLLQSHNQWVKVVENDFDQSLLNLTPIKVANTLKVSIGRLRKMNIGKNFLSAFSVGDQLLWGAAEPLRRMLCKLL